MKTSLLSKILMLLISLMISFVVYSQSEDANSKKGYHHEETPGNALIGFSRTFYTGFALQVVGVGVYVIGQSGKQTDDKTIKTFSYVGGAIALVGTIIELVSFGSIGKAGRLLNEQHLSKSNITINIEPTQYGVGVVCRF